MKQSEFKLKIISDGTSNGTRVVRADTGEKLEGVRKAAWVCMAGEIAIARFELIGVEIEASAEISEISMNGEPDNGTDDAG